MYTTIQQNSIQINMYKYVMCVKRTVTQENNTHTHTCKMKKEQEHRNSYAYD